MLSLNYWRIFLFVPLSVKSYAYDTTIYAMYVFMKLLLHNKFVLKKHSLYEYEVPLGYQLWKLNYLINYADTYYS